MALLELRGVSKGFGGVKAVQRVDIAIEPGEVHGLIGPNGAGKTTVINLMTGIYRPDEGSILLEGKRIDGASPHRIAQMGVVRTFQNIRLFHSLTVLENVLAAQIPAAKAGFFPTILGTAGSRREIAAQRQRGMELLDLLGLAEQADRVSGALPYGRQKVLEIARALAAGPRLLLLDEPAAGLTGAELDELLVRLDQIRQSGVTLLVIEHHMKLIMSVCHRITVLNFGRRIALGTPEETQNNEAVIAAYLGQEQEDDTHVGA